MKSFILSLGIVLVFPITFALACPGLDEGEAAIVHSFEADGDLNPEPEGIALDLRGNLYVSVRSFDGTSHVKNEVVRIDSSGNEQVIADLGAAEPGCSGILGLTTDWWGNVYAAFVSCNERHGVWKIRPDGRTYRLAGSENIVVPNALTFDWRGNLYVTDSYPAEDTGPGIVWKYSRRGRSFKKWAVSELLAPDPVIDPFPFPAPGANGIAFVPPNKLYVANNEKSLILEIPVMRNGQAGEISIVAGEWPPAGPPGLLFAPDGLSADVKGNLYSVVPAVGLTGFPLSPLIRINPNTGEVDPIVEPTVVPSEFFDFPTSLAFGTRRKDNKTLYVVNPTSGVPIEGAAGASVTQVGIGVRGIPGQ